MCVHTAAAGDHSAVNMTCNVTVRPYTETLLLRRCTQIRPGSRSLRLGLLLAAELGATSVVRGVLGVRGIVTASTSSED